MREPVAYRQTLELLTQRAKEENIPGIIVNASQAAKLTGMTRQRIAKYGLRDPISLAKLAWVISQ